jgi:rfaE bifunctional protein kinase chain/domain
MGLRFPQQVARIDRIDRRPVTGDTEAHICAAISTLAANADVVIASDYLTGLLTPRIVDAVRAVARTRNLRMVADAQGELHKYADFDMVKCNADEASRYVSQPLRSSRDFENAGAQIAEALAVRLGVLITRGPDGITLIRRDEQPLHIPAPHIEDVYDTVGAGDTVVAIIALALAAGISAPHGAMLANVGAGIVIRKVGNYAPSPDELRAAIRDQAMSTAT